jgi:RHS repeat-associated protein
VSVDGAQVIHMNGRIYDPQLGRFLQPDPVIQEPTNAQSWNAYTYVFNNPLAYTDPTGMMSERAWNNVWRGLGLVISIISMGATSWHMGISTQAGITAAAAGGFFAGYAATGTLKSAVIGAFSAAITAGIAGSGMSGYEQMAAQAVTGGVVESLQGGSFGHGFVAAGLTANFMPQVGGYSAPVRTALGALIGGTISAVTGGKFANGAISGAVQGAMARKPAPALEADDSAVTGSANGTDENVDSHTIRQVDLAPGLEMTPEHETAINNINDALARYGRAVYASGNQEGIRDYNTATLLYDPKAVEAYSAKYGVNAAAYATINKNKITFGRRAFQHRSSMWGTFGDQTSMTILPMRMSSVYTAYLTHEFGHLHSMYTVDGELGSANYIRYMRPYLRATGTMMLPIVPKP